MMMSLISTDCVVTPPGVGLLVEHLLDLPPQLVAFREQLGEVVLADGVPEATSAPTGRLRA